MEVRFAEGLPVITGDRVQLQQVVLNLILNALQAMGAVSEGARQMLITTSQTEEPFYTTKPNGMGMGLAICHPIVEAHGGHLRATACEPHGALFQFTTRPA